MNPNTPTLNDADNNTIQRVSLNKSEKIIDLSIDVRQSKLVNDFKILPIEEPTVSAKRKSPGSVRSSRLVNDFKGLLHNVPSSSTLKCDFENSYDDIKAKSSQEMNIPSPATRSNLDNTFKANTLLQLHSSGGNSIRERKKALAKVNFYFILLHHFSLIIFTFYIKRI